MIEFILCIVLGIIVLACIMVALGESESPQSSSTKKYIQPGREHWTQAERDREDEREIHISKQMCNKGYNEQDW